MFRENGTLTPSQSHSPPGIASPSPSQTSIPPPPLAQASSHPSSTPLTGVMEKKKKSLMMHKSDLNCYVQKLGLPIPLYRTLVEGSCDNVHGFRFRSTVSVCKRSFTSSNTFSNRKSAEQDVAKLALEQLVAESEAIDANLRLYLRKLVCQDKVRCKVILKEFTDKTKMGSVYETVQVQTPNPVFISTLTINGNCYKGEACKSKKEAEQLVALVAICSLLDDSKYATSISKVIKSKFNVSASFFESKDFTANTRDCSVTDNEFKTTAFNSDSTPLSQQGSSIDQNGFRVLVDEKMPTSINLMSDNIKKQGGSGILVNEMKQDLVDSLARVEIVVSKNEQDLVSALPRVDMVVNKNEQDLVDSLPWAEMVFNKNERDLVDSLPRVEMMVNKNERYLVDSLPETDKQCGHGVLEDKQGRTGLHSEAVTISRSSYVSLPTTSPLFSEPRHEIRSTETSSRPASQQINVPIEFVQPAAPSAACDSIASRKRRRNKKKAEKKKAKMKRLRAENNLS